MSAQKVISFEYDLRESGGDEIIDSSRGARPLEFVTGSGMLIPGLEEKINGMNSGERDLIVVEPKDAYGGYNEEAVQTLPVEQFAGIELEKGMQLYGQGENGETIQVTVKDFNNESVTVDYNHPLAGKTLEFDVEIVDVRDATEEEIATGQAQSDSCDTGCGCH